MTNDRGLAGRSHTEQVSFAAGECIFRQGDSADTAFFVKKGKVALTHHQEGRQMEICHIGRGEVLGEMAVLDGGCHHATALALEDCVLAVVPPTLFHHKLIKSDHFLRALIAMIIKNIRTSPRLFLRRPRSLRDHVRQMAAFSWNLRRFAGRLDDSQQTEEILNVLDRLDTVLDDLADVAEQTADKRHDLILDPELNGVDFADVIGSEGRRRV